MNLVAPHVNADPAKRAVSSGVGGPDPQQHIGDYLVPRQVPNLRGTAHHAQEPDLSRRKPLSGDVSPLVRQHVNPRLAMCHPLSGSASLGWLSPRQEDYNPLPKARHLLSGNASTLAKQCAPSSATIPPFFITSAGTCSAPDPQDTPA